MNKYETILDALRETGEDRSVLDAPGTAHLVAEGNSILSARTVPGLEVETRETATGIAATVLVREGVRIERPVHLCFGVVHPRGLQTIRMDLRLERGSAAHFIAHCLFPIAEEVRHEMEATVDIGEGAELNYNEVHFHGPFGGITVIPRSTVTVGRNGRYRGDFTLTTGRVGTLDLNATVHAAEGSITELTARVLGSGGDRIIIREAVSLDGDNARSIIKTRIALKDDAFAEVTGVTEGNAAGAHGHVDCMELLRDRAVAKAVPMVSVTNPLAKVTHEAAIGTVDRRQMETLMAHGLSPDEAVDVIVKGILR
jgi:Fe-S cluster assembly scaffold protein SufB